MKSAYRDTRRQSRRLLLESLEGRELLALVSHWTADNTALDSAGPNHGSLVSGATYAAGQVGQAFRFDGINDRVQVADSPSLALTQSLSIEAWVRVDSVNPTTSGQILFRGDDRGGLDPYALWIEPDGTIRFVVTPITNQGVSIWTPAPVGEFFHVAATLDDATGEMKMYLNGSLKAQTVTSTRPFGALDPASNPGVGIGNHGGYPTTPHNFPFHGLIDELKVYDVALTAEQILANFNAAKGSLQPTVSVNDVTTTEGDGSINYLGNLVNPAAGGMDSPYQMIYGPDGHLYVSTLPSSSVLRYDAATGAPLPAPGKSGAEFVSPGAGGLSVARSIAFGPDGHLYVVGQNSDAIHRYDGLTGQPLGDLVPAGTGGLDQPRGLLFHSDGYLYVTSVGATSTGDGVDSVLRFDALTGTPAGTSGLTGDAVFIAAGSGGMDNPSQIIFHDGSFFVASTSPSTSNSVLKFAPNGTFLSAFVPTGSGGLSGPAFIEFHDGYLYVASWANNKILRYDGNTGAFVDEAASGNGLLNPLGILFEPSGDFLVASRDSDEIRRYGQTEAAVFTVSLNAPFPTPVSVNYATANGTATAGSDYTAVSGSLSFTPGEWRKTVTVPILDDAAIESSETILLNLSNPVDGLITDGQGVGTILDDDAPREIHVSDASAMEGSNVGKFIDTFVASGSGGLVSPHGVTFGADGRMYVASRTTDEILRYDANGAFIGAFVTMGHGGLNAPYGITFGPDGNLYVSSRDSDQILRYQGTDGSFLGVFTTGRSLELPGPIAFGPDGALYVTSETGVTTSEIVRFNGTTGAFMNVVAASGSGGLDDPRGLAFGPDGNIYVSEPAMNSILRFNRTTGAFMGNFVTSGSGGIDDPREIAFGPDGNLYVAEYQSNSVLRYNGATGAFLDGFVPNGAGGLNVPQGLAFGLDGNLYVGSFQGNAILRYGRASLAVFTISLSAASTSPVSVSYSTADGTALVSSDFSASSGTITFAPGQTSRTILIQTLDDTAYEVNETFVVNLSNPVGGVIADWQGIGTIQDDDASRSISISDATATEGDSALRFIDAFVPAGSGGLNGPREVVFGPDGYLYVATGLTGQAPGSEDSNRVLRFDAQTGAFVDVAFASGDSGVHFDLPWAMTFGPDGKLYVSGRRSDNVVRYDPATDTVEEFVAAGSGVYRPAGLAFGPDGNLYVANSDQGDTDTSPLQDRVLRFQGPGGASPGQFVDVFVLPGNGLNNANGIKFHASSLFVSSTRSNSVLRYNGSTGAFQGAFVQAGSGGVTTPSFLTFRSDGYLYVNSQSTDQVLRYNSTTGAFVDVVVPSGSGGLDEPAGFAFDAAGNIYVASRINSQVLRYGAASQAAFTVSLNVPSSQQVSVSYVTANGSALAGSDFAATSGTVTFAPGQTTQTVFVQTLDDVAVEGNETFSVNLSTPIGGVIADGQGTGTIQDDDASRSISISDATAAEGNSPYQFTDYFVAPDAYGLAASRATLIGPDGNLYVASLDTDVIKVFEVATGRFLRDLGTSGGELDRPWVMEFDASGRLYVRGGSASGDTMIVRFDNLQTGDYSLIVSPAEAAAMGLVPGFGMEFGPDGNLYVSSDDSVFLLDGETGDFLEVFVPAGSGGLATASGLEFGPSGDLYVASFHSGQLLRFDGETGSFEGVFVQSGAGGLAKPSQFTFHTDGFLYVVDVTLQQMLRFNAATGAFLSVFVSDPRIIGNHFAFGPSGELYMSGGTGTGLPGSFVGRYAPGSHAAFTVTLSSPSNLPVRVNFATASGTATIGSDFFGSSGTITFAPGEVTRTILVKSIDDLAYEATETFAVNLSNPVGGIIADSQGVATIQDNDPQPTKFYVVDDGSTNKTFEYGAGGSAIENYAINSGNTAPRGAASTAAGDKVWVVDNNRKVFVYNTSGGLLGSWTAGTLASNAQPQGIATNGTDVWIVDAKSDKVFRYTGAATRLSGSQNAASSFNLNSGNGAPTDIVTDGTSLWVLNDSSTDKVFKYSVSGTLLGSWTINAGGGSPTGLTIDPSAVSHIWIVDSSTDRVYQFDNAASRTSGSQSPSASFPLAAGNTNPQGIADPPSDSVGNALRGVPPTQARSASKGNALSTHDAALLALTAELDALFTASRKKR